MPIITLISIFSIAGVISRRMALPSAAGLLIATSAILVTLYVAALAGVIWWAALAIHLAGVTLVGFWALRAIRDSRLPAIPMPYIVATAAVGLFWLVHHGSQFYFYDEYGHWGIYLKDMLALDELWNADSNTRHPRYLPGPTIWQYFFSVFGPRTDSVAYLGQFFLLIVPLLALWEGLRLRQAGWTVAIALFSLFVLANFGNGLASLYVDQMLGTWFIGTLLSFMLVRPEGPARLLVFAAPILTLALIKESGIAFALAAAGIVIALWWYDRIARKQAVAGTTVRGLVYGLALILPAFIAVQAWQSNRDALGIERAGTSATAVFSTLFDPVEPSDQELRTEISRRYRDVVLNQQLSRDETSWQFNAFSYPLMELYKDRFRLTTASMIALFILWQLLVSNFVLRGSERIRWGILASGLLATSGGYLAMLYLSYVHTLGEYGLLISSYVRYVYSLAIPLLIACAAPLLPTFRSPDNGPEFPLAGRAVKIGTLFFAVGALVLGAFERPFIKPLIEENPRISLRQQTDEVSSRIRAVAGTSRLWVYLPNDQPNGFVGRLLQFQLAPTPTSVERAAAFMEQDPRAIMQAWASYEYLWFPADLPELVVQMDANRGVQESTFFRIGRTPNGMTLESVDLFGQVP